MTTRRRVLLSMAGVFGLLLVLLALTPFLFRGRIEARIKAGIGKSVDATVDWRRADLSIFRSFPNLSLQLHDLVVAGVGPFAADTLLAVPRFGLVLNLPSVLRGLRGSGPVVVRAVELERPEARLLVLEDGSANWDIFRDQGDAQADTAGGLDLSLERLELTGARLSLENRRSQLLAVVRGLDHSLRGDFRQQHFTLETRTTADSASLRFAGVPYLSDVRLDLAADLDADMAAQRFTLRDNQLRINELVLSAEGAVGVAEDSVALDLELAAPRTEFRELLSLVPAIYAQDFAGLETAGTMSVTGRVRGGFGGGRFPALALAAKVENGMFRYPDLPLPARDVFFDLALANPGGHVDSTVVRLDRFHVRLGDDPVDGSFVMRTPVSDPDVEFRLTGRVDLANLGRTVKLEQMEELSGVVVANAGMRARISDVNNQRYERVSADGTVELSDVVLRGEELRQPFRIEQALLRFTPRHIELAAFQGEIGTSDLTMTGSLENLLGFVLRDQELRGQARVASRRFNLDEWRSDDELEYIAVPGNIDFALDARADTVTFGKLMLRDAQGSLHIKDRRVTLQDFRLALLGGGMTVTGFYETIDSIRPAFDVDLGLTELDVPGAFASLRTVQAFAPVAKYAEGRVSAVLRLNGVLGSDMMPVLEVLTGLGSLTTAGLVIRDFPALDRLAETLKLDQLRSPGFVDLKSSIEIKDGRLHVQPFDVRFGQFTMNVAGSNGFDQTLDYTLGLQLPRAALGEAANRAVADIVARTARAGFNLQAADVVTLGVLLTGTVTNPSLATTFRDVAAGAAESVEQAVRDEAERRREEVAQRLDSAATEAANRARAEAAKLVAEAEQRAAAIRAEARALAGRMREEANQRADSLEARPTSAVGRIAAKAAADRLRSEAAARADAIVREADTRADALVAEARRRAGLPPDSSAGGG